MQTEEVLPRVLPTGVEGSPTDGSLFHPQHYPPHAQSPLSPLVNMAVKQEPEEDEDRIRGTNTIRTQVEADVATIGADGRRDHVHQQAHQQILGQDGKSQDAVQETTSRPRPSRGRRKSRWKLKFHHQALPPEYLDHYEAALAQEALNSSPTSITEPTTPSPASATSTSAPSPITDVHGWLQRIAAMQQELCLVAPRNPSLSNTQPTGSRRSVITSTSHSCGSQQHQHQQHHHQQSQPIPRPPMKYSDLPYMGEITLDNSKPRRGRKPKKADICHLIYKNYGTILPGTPGHEERKQDNRMKLETRDQPSQVPFQRTDIQNRISSLLEKRLTQETRRTLALTETLKTTEQEEPLNLCIRDLNQLKIRLLRKHGNVYESGQVKSETSSDAEEVECMGPSSPSAFDPSRPMDSFNNSNGGDPGVGPNPGFVYWPNAGVFIHPMALQSQFLYYQKMAQNEKSLGCADQQPKEQKIVPKTLYSMLDNKMQAPALPLPAPAPPPESPRPKRNAPIGQQMQPTKRKRSAIFIPPMPTENNNNPATEVSICKFKFTGGAKPSLQEKKSLSVDSGGNFRYYSGTGDKSMRGYEFFPRETLQQPAGQAGSSAGAFLSAAGERLPPVGCLRSPNQEENRRKRKTKKSLQREKLEQTFKEKGFLIQTQQLESAEGATYCKFRQLRKFTRYLFRSWKDYLPGNVRELTGVPDGDVGESEVEGDPSVGGSPGPRPGILDVPPPGFLEEPRTLPLT
ncbi:uncharacterized protein LOC105703429 isoform X2 [Orussus abietinus]|nr:uncharacterized protein LOC105703429 isoform X2 [Orussus abietinus]